MQSYNPSSWEVELGEKEKDWKAHRPASIAYPMWWTDRACLKHVWMHSMFLAHVFPYSHTHTHTPQTHTDREIDRHAHIHIHWAKTFLVNKSRH